MALLIEGIGDDWIVLRKPGGKPELLHYKTLDEMRAAITRSLARWASAPKPEPRKPVTLPQASPPPPPPPPVVAAKKAIPSLKPLPPDTDCMLCGACCAPQDQRKDTHPALEKEDVQQIPPVLRKSLVVNDGGNFFIKTKRDPNGKTVCAALKGAVGSRCKCGIYDKRPMVCRIFEKGSPECLAARSAFGL